MAGWILIFALLAIVGAFFWFCLWCFLKLFSWEGPSKPRTKEELELEEEYEMHDFMADGELDGNIFPRDDR